MLKIWDMNGTRKSSEFLFCSKRGTLMGHEKIPNVIFVQKGGHERDTKNLPISFWFKMGDMNGTRNNYQTILKYIANVPHKYRKKKYQISLLFKIWDMNGA